jgi:MFS family permease
MLAGAGLLVAFVVFERRSREPMMPPSLFRSAQFSGANMVTLAVYAGLGVALFVVVLNLQRGLGYSALKAGAALAPMTVLLLLFSARAGAFAQRVGPTPPMVAGPIVASFGLAWLSFLRPGDHYVSSVLPAVSVLGVGMALTVAPLTAVVMAAVDQRLLGIASGVNNAVARLAGLFAVAGVPAIAGLEVSARPGVGLPGYGRALLIAAALCATGGVVAAVTIRQARRMPATVQSGVIEPCHDPCRAEEAQAA